MDFELFGCPIEQCGNPDSEALNGFFPGAGSFSIDSELLGSTTQTLIGFSQLQSFSLAFPVATWSFGQLNLDEGGCSLADSLGCGMLFTGTRFDGFAGAFAFADDSFTSLVRFTSEGLSKLETIIEGEPGPGGGVRGGLLLTDTVADARMSIAPTASAAVPEPESWALFAAGAALLGAATRRRRGKRPV